MEFSYHPTDAVAPLLHAWVIALGPLAALAAVVAALLAIWLTGRMLSHVMILVPGTIAGALTGWWCYHTHHWHMLLAIIAGVIAAGAVYRIFGNFYLARLAAAVAFAPIAVWAVWHLASGAFDPVWTLAITAIATATLASLLRIFINSEDQAMRAWAIDVIDLVRGD